MSSAGKHSDADSAQGAAEIVRRLLDESESELVDIPPTLTTAIRKFRGLEPTRERATGLVEACLSEFWPKVVPAAMRQAACEAISGQLIDDEASLMRLRRLLGTVSD